MNPIIKKLKAIRRSILSTDYLLTDKASNYDPSQFGEAKIIEFIIQCLSKQGHIIPPTFLEIGANSPYQLSSTWYLEKTSNFSGISIDPISNLSYQFKKYRPKTAFINKAFVSSALKSKTITFYQSNIEVLSTCDLDEVTIMKEMGFSFDTQEVETVCAEDLFPYYNERIGVLILDIESLSLQLKILQDIVNTELKPHIICVESLDFSPRSSNLRSEYDHILSNEYSFTAGTFLNSIYICKSLSVN